MELNLKTAEPRSAECDKKTVVGWEIETMEADVGRLAEQLNVTRKKRMEISDQANRFKKAAAHLDKELEKLADREAAEKKMLRDRRVALLDLQAEVE